MAILSLTKVCKHWYELGHGSVRRSDPQTSLTNRVYTRAIVDRNSERSGISARAGAFRDANTRGVLDARGTIRFRDTYSPLYVRGACTVFLYVYPVTVYINAFLRAYGSLLSASVVDTASGRTIPFVSRFSRAQCLLYVSPDKPERSRDGIAVLVHPRPCTSSNAAGISWKKFIIHKYDKLLKLNKIAGIFWRATQKVSCIFIIHRYFSPSPSLLPTA